MANLAMEAEPYELEFDPKSTALLIIDMQRDFVMPGGFGEALGNDVMPLQATIAPTARVLAAARKRGMLVIHTREGHRPDLTDCPPSKLVRGPFYSSSPGTKNKWWSSDCCIPGRQIGALIFPVS